MKRRTCRECAQRSNHAPAGMKEGENIAVAVLSTQTPLARNEQRVVENAAVGENHSFRKSGCAGRILNLGRVPWLHRCLSLAKLLHTDGHASPYHLLKEQRS